MAEQVDPDGTPMPEGEIREDVLWKNSPGMDEKLMFHIDEDPDVATHPLDKKAWIWGKPVEVRP